MFGSEKMTQTNKVHETLIVLHARPRNPLPMKNGPGLNITS